MNKIKRMTALILAMIMLFSLAAPGMWTTHVHAAENNRFHTEMTRINPLYEDVITEDDLVQPAPITLYADNTHYEEGYCSPSYAGELIRDDLVARDETIIVTAYGDFKGESTVQADARALAEEVLGWAMAHTGVANEGDYLAWQYGGWSASMEGGYDSDYIYLTITYTMTYYTTASQEDQVTARVNSLLDELDVYDADSYTKLKAIYDYICTNVTYDHENLENEDYDLKYTAYAALMNGTAVCQGYALLLYRLALELGVDARLIAGDGDGPHGWNIAEIDDLYYNLDSTWDAGQTSYNYFLVCPDNFTDHVRYAEYDTERFHNVYPMSDKDYCRHTYRSEVQSEPTCTENGVTIHTCIDCGYSYKEIITSPGHTMDGGVITTAPTCTEEGVKTFTCTACGMSYVSSVPATGHIWDDGTVTAPTCTEQGHTTFTCTACGITYDDLYVDALGHSYDDGVTTTAPTCTEDGVKTITCTACGDAYTEVIPALGHTKNEGVVVQEPTCSVPGVMAYVCTVCEAEFTGPIAVTPHDFVDGACSVCGEQQMAVPTILSCYSKLQDSVKVTWTTDENADGYELYRTTDPESGEWVRVKTINNGSTDRYTNQGLEVGVTYYYKVRAFADNGDGTKTYTDFSNVDYMPAAVVFDAPYSNSTFRIRLRWNEIGGAHGYQIWRQNADGSWAIVKTLGDKGNTLTNNQGAATAYSNTGLNAGEIYTYKMRAFMITEDGRKVFGAYSDEYTVAVMPESPAGIVLTKTGTGSLKMSWEAVNGAAGYQIWMAEGADGSYKIIKSVTDGSTTYTKKDLAPGTTYYFKIRAYTEVNGKKTFGAYCDPFAMNM